MSSLRELTARRELLWNLTLREMRGRYKRSALGWGWSMLNPLATMCIYTFVFAIVLQAKPPVGDPSELEVYALFLLTALLPWNFFATSVSTSMGSILGNSGLVGKVAFPREHLVLASVLSALVTFAIEIAVLTVVLLIAGSMVLPMLPVVAVVTLLVAAFGTGVGFVLAAGNVFFRDTAYLWGIVSQVWFFVTPIVYSPALVEPRLPDWLYAIYSHLPMTIAVSMYRDLLYDRRMPPALDFVYLGVVAAITLVIGWRIFARLAPRFAEEL